MSPQLSRTWEELSLAQIKRRTSTKTGDSTKGSPSPDPEPIQLSQTLVATTERHQQRLVKIRTHEMCEPQPASIRKLANHESSVFTKVEKEVIRSI